MFQVRDAEHHLDVVIIAWLQGFFSQIVRLAESGLATKTPRQGKKPVRWLLLPQLQYFKIPDEIRKCPQIFVNDCGPGEYPD